MDNEQFIFELSKLKSSAMFLTLKGYSAESGEISDFDIVFHISYKNALLKSVSVLENYTAQDDLEAKAKEELLLSFKNSIDKIESSTIEEIDDGYIRYADYNGNYIKGVKLHEKTNTLHIYGFVVHKKVIMPGEYKKTNKRPLTIAKDKLKKLCPVSKFRQFKITSEHVNSISVANLSLIPPESDL